MSTIAGAFFFTDFQSYQTSTGSVDRTMWAKDTMLMDNASSAKEIKPIPPRPKWDPTIGPQMQALIEKLTSCQDKPTAELSAVPTRKNHTPTEEVIDLC